MAAAFIDFGLSDFEHVLVLHCLLFDGDLTNDMICPRRYACTNQTIYFP